MRPGMLLESQSTECSQINKYLIPPISCKYQIMFQYETMQNIGHIHIKISYSEIQI